MTIQSGEIWTLIALLGAGTYILRLSFLGFIGARKLPDWVLRHLRYTPMAFIPAIAAPLVLWPPATGGEPDAARLAAAAVTLLVGFTTRNVLYAVLAGLAVLYAGLAMLPG